MREIESWLVSFIKSPQFPWIALIFVGLILVEIILHNENQSCRKIATGISSCFGMFCVYVLTAVFFGPIHHSFLGEFDLSSCLPFLSEDLITLSDWAVFSIFKFPAERSDLCYGLLKLLLICLVYNLINDIIENVLKGRETRFVVWVAAQAAFILIFTVVLSSFNYIIERLSYYIPPLGRILQFVREQSLIVFLFVAAILVVIIFTKVVLSVIGGKNIDDIPVLGFITNLFFENAVGAALIKAAVTEYFLVLVFKIITITYIKDFVFDSSGQFILVSVFMLVFMWYMIRQELYHD